LLRHTERSLQEPMVGSFPCHSLQRTPRSDPSILLGAGAPCDKTAALANHLHSPRGPLRLSPCQMDEFVTSPRRQLQRGASCPPARTDPITHTLFAATDSLSFRQLEYGHLTARDRTLRKNGYTAHSATGKLDLKTHSQTSCELHEQARAPAPSLGLNSASLAGEEHILRCVRPVASDTPVSARYAKVNNRRDLTFIDISSLGGRKAVNESLRTSPDLYECLGQLNLAGGTLTPIRRSPPASEVGSQRADAPKPVPATLITPRLLNSDCRPSGSSAPSESNVSSRARFTLVQEAMQPQ